MTKYIIQIDGMMCNMCSIHINDKLRANFDIIKLKTSHKKGVSEFVSKENISDQKITDVLSSIGYTVISITHQDYPKKKLF